MKTFYQYVKENDEMGLGADSETDMDMGDSLGGDDMGAGDGDVQPGDFESAINAIMEICQKVLAPQDEMGGGMGGMGGGEPERISRPGADRAGAPDDSGFGQ